MLIDFSFFQEIQEIDAQWDESCNDSDETPNSYGIASNGFGSTTTDVALHQLNLMQLKLIWNCICSIWIDIKQDL